TSSCGATTAPTPTTSPWSSTTPTRASARSCAAPTCSTRRRASSGSARGSAGLDSRRRQLCLGARLGLPAPRHAHVALMLGPDGTRLAKRHGAVTLADRAAQGQTADDVRDELAATLH